MHQLHKVACFYIEDMLSCGVFSSLIMLVQVDAVTPFKNIPCGYHQMIFWQKLGAELRLHEPPSCQSRL